MITQRQQKWLTTPWLQDDPTAPRRNPIFRKAVCLDGHVESASIDICGLGHYELYINGSRVSDRVLEPAFTDYDKRVHFSTYDIAPYLENRENVFAIYLGRGRYDMNTTSVWAFEKAPWRAQCRFTLAGNVEANGSAVPLDTTAWKCTEGPIYRDSMYEGEGFDARLEPTGWMTSGFDDSAWDDAVETNAPKGELQSTDIEPIRIVDEVPVSRTVCVDETRAVFEFPDMLAGNVRIRVDEPVGTRIHIAYAESYDGSHKACKQEHVSGNYFQEDDYICSGIGEEVWHARFSYKGFRYVEITGFTSGFNADQVTALDTHQDLHSRGSFRCSNDLINRIHHASRRALLNNAHHVMTDTPTYEKNGWTGDAQLTAPMGLCNFEIERFYRKFVTDLRDSQLPSGELAPIVPTSGWGLTDHPNAEGKPFKGHMPAWDGAIFVVPWEIYQYTGDIEVISENYSAMQKYLAFIESRADDYILPKGLGDWLPPGGSPSERAIISSTCWFYKLTDMLLNSAALVGDVECQERCRDLKPRIGEAFNKRFLNESGDAYETGWETEYRQTSAIQPLAFGLVPDENHDAVFGRLTSEICATGTPRLDTGILGTRFLLDVLTDNGEVDLAYDILTGEEYPSWGYWFAKGRVSLGEQWELSSRSWTHHMAGSVDIWLYRHIAGIAPARPGFAEVTIAPNLPSALERATATLGTPVGEIRSSWQRSPRGCLFEFDMPEGAKATFSLPHGLPSTDTTDDRLRTGVQLPAGRSSLLVEGNGALILAGDVRE